jgi:transposase
MARGDLTTAEWRRLAPLLPRNGERPGNPWKPHRRIVNGIRWVQRTGAGWRDAPRRRYGPWQTLYDRFARWERDGTWDRVLQALQGQADAAGEVDWEVSVDGSVVRAHQHAAGARHAPAKKGGPRTRPTRRWAAAGAVSPPRST